MSMLSSLKEEKRLSFDHWRYRLLHWTFNVENADASEPHKTGLPRFLYTHFCPLFHLTNLIALLLPAILAIRLTVILVKAGLVASALAAAPLVWALSKCQEWHERHKSSKGETVARTVTREDELRLLAQYLRLSSPSNFNAFWEVWCGDFAILTKEESHFLFNQHRIHLDNARTRRQRRQDALRERLAFWANFSRVFLKWAMNALYAALAVGLLYLAYRGSGVAWYALTSVASGLWWLVGLVFSLTGLFFVGKVVLLTGVVMGGLYGILRLKVAQKFCEVGYQGVTALAPPVYVVGRFFSWAGASLKSVGEFAAMFYEESCPPITLLTPEQAVLEEEGLAPEGKVA